MTGNLASNALYRKYEEEKSLLETYGHVSSLTYEEWLETKKTNKTMESTIKWQIGVPKKKGVYLLTLKNQAVCIDHLGNNHVWKRFEDDDIAAWCKLSDIEPYKKEKK